MKKFDFYISYLCSSKCIFCSVQDKIALFGKESVLPLSEVIKILYTKKKNGFKYVIFTGGEPTLHPNFLEIIRFAKKLNYRISVNSNLLNFADEKFFTATIPFIDEIVASIHGPNAEIHNFLTKEKNGFQKFKKAMENIENYNSNIYLLADTVVTKHNLKYIMDTLKFITSFKKVKHILISFVNIQPEIKHLFFDMSPTLTEFEKFLPKIVNFVKSKKLMLNFYGVPICILKDYKIYSTDMSFEPKVVVQKMKTETSFFDAEVKTPKPTQAKTKSIKCKECMYDAVCGGVFNSYFEVIGDKELIPIIKKII